MDFNKTNIGAVANGAFSPFTTAFFFYKDRLYRVDLEAGGPKIAAGCNRSSFSFSSQSLQAAFRRLALLLARLTDIGNPAHTQRARRQELRAWLQCCARMLVQIALLVDRFVDTVEIAVFFSVMQQRSIRFTG